LAGEIRYPIRFFGGLLQNLGCRLRVGKPGDSVWVWENPRSPLRGGTPRAPALTLEPGESTISHEHAIYHAGLLGLDMQEFAQALRPAWEAYSRRERDPGS